MSHVNITEKQADLLVDSLSDALVKLAEGGILKYQDPFLSTYCAEKEEFEGDLRVDIQAILPLAFNPVEGINLSHAEIVGFVSLCQCQMTENTDENGETKQTLSWHGKMSDVTMNFGYHSNNIVWAANKDMSKPDEYRGDEPHAWLEPDELGFSYKQDGAMCLKVVNKALDKMPEAVQLKFINELVKLANRTEIT